MCKLLRQRPRPYCTRLNCCRVEVHSSSSLTSFYHHHRERRSPSSSRRLAFDLAGARPEACEGVSRRGGGLWNQTVARCIALVAADDHAGSGTITEIRARSRNHRGRVRPWRCYILLPRFARNEDLACRARAPWPAGLAACEERFETNDVQTTLTPARCDTPGAT